MCAAAHQKLLSLSPSSSAHVILRRFFFFSIQYVKQKRRFTLNMHSLVHCIYTPIDDIISVSPNDHLFSLSRFSKIQQEREKEVFKIQQESDDLFKIQQEREKDVFKIQQESDDLFKIRQEREKDVFKIQQQSDDLFKIQQEREKEVFKIQQERENGDHRVMDLEWSRVVVPCEASLRTT